MYVGSKKLAPKEVISHEYGHVLFDIAGYRFSKTHRRFSDFEESSWKTDARVESLKGKLPRTKGPARKALKRKCLLHKSKKKVTEVDIDLLPWNFNGTILNTAKLDKYGITSSPAGRSVIRSKSLCSSAGADDIAVLAEALWVDTSISY